MLAVDRFMNQSVRKQLRWGEREMSTIESLPEEMEVELEPSTVAEDIHDIILMNLIPEPITSLEQVVGLRKVA